MAITAKEAIEAISKNHGIVATSAKHLGISRQQLHNIINNYPTVKQAVIDAREEMKDFAESKIYKKISDGDTTMIIFYAKTQMRDRGYNESHTIVGKDDGPIEIDVGGSAIEKLVGALNSIAAREPEADNIKPAD